jgi:glycosyltransferase involved in cell wall biosynthesis
MRLASFFPVHFSNSGIGYCALSILEAMESEAIHGTIMATTSNKDFSHPFYQDAIPSMFNPIVYKLFSQKQLNKIAEWRFSQTLDTQEFVLFWSGDVSLSFYEKVHARGHRIIMEAVNTTQVYRKEILDAEYLRLGLPPTHGATSETIANENAKFQLASFVYSTSPEVRKSLAVAGVPEEKLLHTSYGLRQSDILSPADIDARKQHKMFTAIFVGSIGVRKGVHLLVDYWSQSKVKGKLKLVGHIDEEIMPILAPYLQRDDIEHVPFVNDLRDIYKEADVFMLPSLEEGSPLVTYLALGAGLPSIVSPMGSGGLITNEEEGLVIDPHDKVGWIKALQHIAENAKLREACAFKAYEKAPNYLWSEVGRKRAEALLSKT